MGEGYAAIQRGRAACIGGWGMSCLMTQSAGSVTTQMAYDYCMSWFSELCTGTLLFKTGHGRFAILEDFLFLKHLQH
jgi:hypothetical protein